MAFLLFNLWQFSPQGEDKIGNPVAGSGHKAIPPRLPRHPPLAGKRLPRERNFRVLIKGSWCNPTRLKLQPVTLQARESSSPREAKLSQHRPYFVSVYGLLGNLIRARDARESPHRSMPQRGISRSNFFFIRPSKKIIPAQSGGSVSPATAGSRERTDRFRDITAGALQESDFIKLIHLFFLYLSVIKFNSYIQKEERESIAHKRLLSYRCFKIDILLRFRRSLDIHSLTRNLIFIYWLAKFLHTFYWIFDISLHPCVCCNIFNPLWSTHRIIDTKQKEDSLQ